MENLAQSADAMDGTRTIKAEIYHEDHYVCIDLSDTGKGCPRINLNRYSNLDIPLKPGWTGIVLLAKRIIENYHKGKIFVKNQLLGAGTTFTVKVLYRVITIS